MKKITIGFCLLLLLAPPLRAAFEDVETGARATAMAGAFVAQGDDVSAIFYNPAGLRGLDRYELMASHEKLFYGLSDGSSLARSLFAFGAPVVIRGRYWGNAAFSWDTLSLSGLYDEARVMLGYSYPVKDNLWAGLSLSRLSVSYGSDDYTRLNPVFDRGSQVASLGVDAGILARFGALDVGLSLQNLNEPDLGLKYSNKVDRRINLGLSLKQENSTWDLALALIGRDFRVKTGTELPVFRKLLKDRVLARGGVSLGSRDYRNAALGFGYRDALYRIDYSFVYPLSGIAQTFGSHQLCLSLGWGAPLAARAPENGEEAKDKGGAGGGFIPGKAGRRGDDAEAGKDGIAGQVQLEEPYREITLDERRRARVLLGEARGLVEKGRYLDALEQYRQADKILRIDPEVKDSLARIMTVVDISSNVVSGSSRDDLVRKSVARYMSGSPDAVIFATYACQKWPNDALAARVRETVAKSFPEAASNLRLLPGISIVDQMLQDALDLIRGGRFIQAVASLEKVLELDPNNVTALTRMGSAYWAMGKKDIAVRTWKRVLQLDPGNVEVKEFMKAY